MTAAKNRGRAGEPEGVPRDPLASGRSELELQKERLRVDKRRLESTVGLRKRVVSELVTLSVPVVVDAEVRITRRPPAAGRTPSRLGVAQDVVVPLMRDEVRLQSRARVYERVRLERETHRERRPLEDRVRREVVAEERRPLGDEDAEP